ncbi:MAG: rhodanese-like domain-containing protein [Litorivicinus sp.]
MTDQIIEFVSNNYFLVGAWFIVLVGFILNEKRRGGKAVSPTQAVIKMNRENALVIDVREPKDYKAGHINGALNWPLTKLDSFMSEVPKYSDRPLLVVCKMGSSAGAAVKKLAAAGHLDVYRVSGGMMDWTANNLPVKK